MNDPKFGLGRIAAPDPRDRMHMMPKKITTRRYRYWPAYRYWLDQGATPQCVAYSWSHFLVDAPMSHPLDLSPLIIYNEAQKLDEWPGEDYEGTSVRAGAKVLKAHARVSSYQWAFDLETVIYHLLEVGPVIVGTNWYEQMFYPKPVAGTKAYKISIGGEIAGGHAYKLDGINLDLSFIRMKNSWGQSWANRGFARISLSDVERLIAEDGEACRAVEIGA